MSAVAALRRLRHGPLKFLAPLWIWLGRDEQEAISFFEQTWVSGRNSLTVKRDHADFIKTTRRQVSLDHHCARHDLAPEVIKIDVEGAEYDVLLGARETLRHHRPKVFLSIHPTELKLLGSSVEALAELIADLGYQCHEMDGSPVTRFRLSEYILTPENEEKSC